MISDHEVAEHVRNYLSSRGRFTVAEKQMMGSLTFMVDGKMCCSVGKGRLMVRVGREAYEPALAEPQVTPLEFAGRRAIGYVCVEANALPSARALDRWLERGLAFVDTLPAKPAKDKQKKPRKP